jgi:hypothetical protein
MKSEALVEGSLVFWPSHKWVAPFASVLYKICHEYKYTVLLDIQVGVVRHCP